jgi:hypothetical protein
MEDTTDKKVFYNQKSIGIEAYIEMDEPPLKGFFVEEEDK